MLLIGEKALEHLDTGDVRAFYLAHEQQRARNIRSKVQLLRSDVNIAGKYIVGDYVFKKSRLIVLFLIIHLRLVKGDGRHHARHPRHIVAALNKHGIVKPAVIIAQHLICPHSA